MRLVKVEFINYRSISGDVLDIENDITCLVGINESGKSNVLLALEKVDKDKQLTNAEFSRHSEGFGDPQNSPELKLWFEPIDNEFSPLKELFGTDITTVVLLKSMSGYRLDYPDINYEQSKFYSPQTSSSEDTENKINTPLTEELKNEIRKKIIEELKQNFVPRFLRFDSVNFTEYYLPENGEVVISQFISNPDAMRPVKDLLVLGGITNFNKLQAADDTQRITRDTLLERASKKINEEILRVIWPVESVEVQLGGEGDILKIRLKEKDKTSPFKPEERSRGLQWSLAFNIYFLAEAKAILQNSILLIDEPGIFLHIDAQKKLLKKTFSQITQKGNKIIYATHLPYLIDPDFPERIRILEKNKEDTIIGNKAWSEGEFGKIPEPVRTALGLQWTELFNFSEKNTIVEGPCDQVILRVLHGIFGKDNEINYLPSYGYNKLPSILALVKIEEKHGFGLVDGDGDIKVLREKCLMVSIQDDSLETIPTLLNDNQRITIEDVLPEDIFREAVFKVYYPICIRRRNCSLAKDEIPVDFPRVQKVEQFFSTKFRAQKHKLMKMEIARALSEIVSEINVKKSDKKWEVARSLVEEIEKKFS